MTFKINLEELNPGTFFSFDKENPDEGITLRVLNHEALNEISKKTQIRRSEVKGDPPTRFDYMEYREGGQEKEFALTWDYCIIDWKGVVDQNGNEIPCTSENKVKLMSGSVSFSDFVVKCTRKLNEASINQEKVREGN